jgi:hypothetical protein
MTRYQYAHTDVNEIGDTDLQNLFDEIAILRSIRKEGKAVQFLHQALHPFGLPETRKFEKTELLPNAILRKTLSKLGKTEIYRALCGSLSHVAKV